MEIDQLYKTIVKKRASTNSIKIGNWLFRYRNYLFPVFYATLFIQSVEIFPELLLAIIWGSLFILAGISIQILTIGFVDIEKSGLYRQIQAENLITNGLYSACRNPIYLGNLVILLGFGLFSNSLLFCIVFLPFFLLIYGTIIKAEEAYLEKKFEYKYVDYKNRTNSLLPRFYGINHVFDRLKFDFIKVINIENNQLFIYLFGVYLLLFKHGLINKLTLAILIISTFLLFIFTKILNIHKKLNSKNHELLVGKNRTSHI